MADDLPEVGGSGGRTYEAIPVRLFGGEGVGCKTTPDGELYTTTTERENPFFVAVRLADVAADTHKMLIDVTDTADWPHTYGDYVDITSAFLGVDKEANTAGYLRIGVISRVDGTDADVEYFVGTTFEKSDERTILRDRVISPSQWRCKIVDGTLTNIFTDFKVENIAAINTGIQLEGPQGVLSTPAVGDVIVTAGWTSGSFNGTASVIYHPEEEV